jgi:hypothetical protein
MRKALTAATGAVSALAIGAVIWSTVCLGGPAAAANTTAAVKITQVSTLTARTQTICAGQTQEAKSSETVSVTPTVYQGEPVEVIELSSIYEVDAQGAEPEPEPVGAGSQTITGVVTYYDACVSCCGKTDGVTASGIIVTNGGEDPHVVACNWLDLGTVIRIDGVTYTVADRGGAGLDTVGRVDIFTPGGHEAALNAGTHTATIEIIGS